MSVNIIFISVGFIVYFVSSFFASFEIDPFYRLYYIFTWYSYIFIVDGIIYSIKRNSLIISRTSEFFYMLFVSFGWWFLFEIFNIFLKNWSYLMLPYDNSLRYFGYIFAYATVLPAIFETSELIETIGIFKKIKTKNFKTNPIKFDNIIWAGILSTLFVLIIPKYLFPFIWFFPLLITEPLNLKLGTRSFIREISGGNMEKVLNISLAGLICGLLWEFWNFKSGAKWVYHLPFLNEPKLFEMPVYGYIGFVFFALECYSFYNLLSYFKKGISWEEDTQTPIFKETKKYFYPIIILSVILISILSINLIDKFTVKTFTAF